MHSGFSPFDSLFVDMLSEHFDVTYLTINPHPIVRFKAVEPTVVKSPLAFAFGSATMRPLDYLVSWPSLRSAILRSKPDVIVGCYATTYGFLAALSGFRPFVLMVYGSDVLVDPLDSVKSRAVRYAISHADLIVVDSKAESGATIALGGDSRKFFSLPWIDLEWVSRIGSQRGLASHGPSGPAGKPMLLCVRYHEPVYNVALVVRAFSTVRSKYPNAVLVLAGHGSLTSSLQKLVNELGLNDAVLFTGLLPRREVIALLDQADIYVSASFSDG
ncbi:MAG: glycosyltransferase, partial [Conexivisphaerales archaeon]